MCARRRAGRAPTRHSAWVFPRWFSWSMRHRVTAGIVSMAGTAGTMMLMVWMLWRYPGGPGGWKEEGSPPQWLPIIATVLVIASAGVAACGVVCDWLSERRSGDSGVASPNG